MKKLLVLLMVVFGMIACSQPGPTVESESDALTKSTAASGEPVVLIHGNGTGTSTWYYTENKLKANGYSDYYIIKPYWLSSSNAANNDHCGSELDKVKSALQTAYSRSKTGKIDVIGHSMGVTLGGKAIRDLNYRSKVRSFVGIAGAFRGLNSCTLSSYLPTCSKNCGLHYQSTILKDIKNYGYLGTYTYSIYSIYDEVVCAGSCYIYGVHSSKPYSSNGNYHYYYGHMTLKNNTASKQYDLIKKN
jgi:pimeloyl-ACP methyl ester carboxylesterase